VFCCVGGGGLIAGVAAYIKRLRPETKIIGVEAVDADAMTQSLAAGKRVTLEQVGLFADGAAVKQVGEENLPPVPAVRRRDDLVDTDAICAAIKDVFEDTRSILEPAGALAVAGAKAYASASTVARQDAGGHRLGRQHEFRPPALRRRARRTRRAARGRAGGDDSREARRYRKSCR
jgi:threonine dehydratase